MGIESKEICKLGNPKADSGLTIHIIALILPTVHVAYCRSYKLQTLISRESDPSDTSIITIGTFNAGDACNIIPDTDRYSRKI